MLIVYLRRRRSCLGPFRWGYGVGTRRSRFSLAKLQTVKLFRDVRNLCLGRIHLWLSTFRWIWGAILLHLQLCIFPLACFLGHVLAPVNLVPCGLLKFRFSFASLAGYCFFFGFGILDYQINRVSWERIGLTTFRFWTNVLGSRHIIC